MTTVLEPEIVEDVDGAPLPEPTAEIYESAFAPVRRDPETGRLLTDSVGRTLPEECISDETSWRNTHRALEMPEGIDVRSADRTRDGFCNVSSAGTSASGLICTRGADHPMPHRGGTSNRTLTGEWGFEAPQEPLAQWERELLEAAHASPDPVATEVTEATEEAEEPQEAVAGTEETAITWPDLPGAPAGTLLRMGTGTRTEPGYYRVANDTGVWGNPDGDWSYRQDEHLGLDTLDARIAHWAMLGATVVGHDYPGSPGVEGAEVPATPVAHGPVPNIRINYRPRGSDDRTQIDIHVPDLNRDGSLTNGPNVSAIRQAIDDYRGAHGQDRLGTRYFWSDEHIELLPETGAPVAVPGQYQSIDGTSLPREWFLENGLDWSSPLDRDSGMLPTTDEEDEDNGCEETIRIPGTDGSRSWGNTWCCTVVHEPGEPHVATSGELILAEWGRVAPTPVVAPPHTSSGGTHLPEEWFRNSPNGLDWNGDSLPGGGYASPSAEITQEILDRGSMCGERTPPTLGIGRSWTCTRQAGHRGHHVATYLNGREALAEWGFEAPPIPWTTLGSIEGLDRSDRLAPGYDPARDPNLLKAEDVARVMSRFAASRPGDNGPESFKLGMARLGIDISSMPARPYTAVVRIDIPVKFFTTDLAGPSSRELSQALPQERIKDALRRFLSAAKLEGVTSLSELEVIADRIDLNVHSVYEQ